MNPGREPVFINASHVMCFYSAKSRNTPQGSESKLLNNVPALKANPGKYLFVCLFCSRVALVCLFCFQISHTCMWTPAIFLPWLTNANELKWGILMPQDIPWEEFSMDQFKTYIEWNRKGERKRLLSVLVSSSPPFFICSYLQKNFSGWLSLQTAFTVERCWNQEGKHRHWWKLMLESSLEATSLGYQYFFSFPLEIISLFFTTAVFRRHSCATGWWFQPRIFKLHVSATPWTCELL